MITKEQAEKILSGRIAINPESTHHVWTGQVNGNGYGQVQINGKKYLTHRLIAFLHLGLDITDIKMQVNHKNECNLTRCVNPDHLYLGTQAQNMKDLDESGRRSKVIASTDPNYCHQGHKYTTINTRIDSYGYKRCRLCERARRRRSK